MHSLLFIPYLNNYHLYLHEYLAIVHFEIAILQLVNCLLFLSLLQLLFDFLSLKCLLYENSAFSEKVSQALLGLVKLHFACAFIFFTSLSLTLGKLHASTS